MPQYEPGNHVWLPTKDIRHTTGCRKLSPCYIGLFKILSINKVTYKLVQPRHFGSWRGVLSSPIPRTTCSLQTWPPQTMTPSTHQRSHVHSHQIAHTWILSTTQYLSTHKTLTQDEVRLSVYLRDLPSFCSLLTLFWFWLSLFLAFTSLDLSSSWCLQIVWSPACFRILLLPNILDYLLNFNKPHLHPQPSPPPDRF